MKKGDIYNMKHRRKGLMRVEIVKDNGEFVDVKILKGKASYMSASNRFAQRVSGLGLEGDTITVRNSLAEWEKVTK